MASFAGSTSSVRWARVALAALLGGVVLFTLGDAQAARLRGFRVRLVIGRR
jgi:hypothetical protein